MEIKSAGVTSELKSEDAALRDIKDANLTLIVFLNVK